MKRGGWSAVVSLIWQCCCLIDDGMWLVNVHVISDSFKDEITWLSSGFLSWWLSPKDTAWSVHSIWCCLLSMQNRVYITVRCPSISVCPIDRHRLADLLLSGCLQQMSITTQCTCSAAVGSVMLRAKECGSAQTCILCVLIMQCIPHVLAMTTDQVADIRTKAELQLIDVNKQHPTYIQVCTAS